MTSVAEVFISEGSFRLEVIDQRALPEQSVGDNEIFHLLKREIRCVPPLLRKVLVMRDVRQLTIRDIAADLGIGIPAKSAGKRVTLAGDRGYHTQAFVEEIRSLNVTPHVAQNTTNRRSAIDG